MLPYKTIHVPFGRKPEIEHARRQLPVCGQEYEIMDAVINHEVVCVSGSTGSGKTTQVPQFLVEAGFGGAESLNPGRVAVTQPRRLATISAAKRVAVELNSIEMVSYKTRFDSKMNDLSKIVFMTDGILLKEMLSDPLLRQYSVIILDEIHERSYNMDMLLSFLCKVLKTRNSKRHSFPPLRLIVMSATPQREIISYLEKHASTVHINVEGSLFPVALHYSKKNPEDYILAVAKKIAKIHKSLPEGKILAFLPAVLDLHSVRDLLGELEEVSIILLHSSMDPSSQDVVFLKRTERDIILATNVAETSLTIPDVSYVVDSGLVKRKVINEEKTGFKFEVGWVSRASADQRTGRAGRTRPGHCYRIYSAETYYSAFPDHEQPEILRTFLDTHILNCLSMGVRSPSKYPIPTLPDPSFFEPAMKRLLSLKAVSEDCQLTELGRVLCHIPLPPDCANIIATAAIRFQSNPEILSLAALVATVNSYEDVILPGNTSKSPDFKSDQILQAYQFLHHVSEPSEGDATLKAKVGALRELKKVFEQVVDICQDIFRVQLSSLDSISFGNQAAEAVRTCIHTTFSDRVALRDSSRSPRNGSVYIDTETGGSAYLSSKSCLFRKQPRCVLYQSKTEDRKGNIFLNKLTLAPASLVQKDRLQSPHGS